jgi:peptidoglycan/xylan/chitin deacetylase (PgdA/CDA1 family)
MVKSIDVMKKITGRSPKGYTAPGWQVSKELLPMLEQYGLEYDHSLMHHDTQPYVIRTFYRPRASHSSFLLYLILIINKVLGTI